MVDAPIPGTEGGWGEGGLRGGNEEGREPLDEEVKYALHAPPMLWKVP